MNHKLAKQLLSSLELTCSLLSQFVLEMDAEDSPHQEKIMWVGDKHKPVVRMFFEEAVITAFFETKYKTDITRVSREKGILLARSLYCYLLRKYTQLSLKAIGELVGGQDHTTVMYSLQCTEKRMKGNPEYRLAIEEAEAELLRYAGNSAQQIA